MSTPPLVAPPVTSTAPAVPPDELVIFGVYALGVVLVIILYVFYTHRFLAWILSRFARWYFWRTYKASIEVDSIKIAMLGGRLLFKRLRYIGHNEMICIHEGNITFRYWLFQTRSGVEQETREQQLPCRLVLTCSGVEWFIYNRTPAYDWVESQLKKTDDALKSEVNTINTTLSWWIQFLPISLVVGRGAIVIGNHKLPTLLVIDWQRADGVYSAVQSRSKHDLYKSVTRIDFRQVQWQLRANVDYERLESGIVSRAVAPQALKPRSRLVKWMKAVFCCCISPKRTTLRRSERHATMSAQRARAQRPFVAGMAARAAQASNNQRVSSSTATALHEDQQTTHWAGLARSYYDWWWSNEAPVAQGSGHTAPHPQATSASNGTTEAFPKWLAGYDREYAKVTTILTCPVLEMVYFYDVVGPTPAHSDAMDLSPEWGVDLVIHQGDICYGPWADRQRTVMQQFFIPFLYRDSVPFVAPSVGQPRVYSALDVHIRFEESCTWRIPHREPSKDTSFMKETQQQAATLGNIAPTRTYAWVDCTMNDGTLHIHVPMLSQLHGSAVTVAFRMQKPDISTSLNYAPLIQGEQLRLNVRMHSPLSWQSKHVWSIEMALHAADLFVLRDHVTLLSDLSSDWTGIGDSIPMDVATSSATPFVSVPFIPYLYEFVLQWTDVTLHLCANDGNVIDQPNDAQDNVFLRIKSPRWHGTASLPVLVYGAEKTRLQMVMEWTKAQILLSFPPSSTLGAFRESEYPVAFMDHWSMEAVYEYHHSVNAKLTDSLQVDCQSRQTRVLWFGSTLRYLSNVAENYVGASMNFVTLDEYRQKQGQPSSNPVQAKRNALDSQMTWCLTENLFMLPQHLHTAHKVCHFRFHELQLDSHSWNTKFLVTATFSPCLITHPDSHSDASHGIHASVEVDLTEPIEPLNKEMRQSYLFVDSLNVFLERNMTPAPQLQTYSSEWRFSVGALTGQCDPDLFTALESWSIRFPFQFEDADNILTLSLQQPIAVQVTMTLSRVQLSLWHLQGRGVTEWIMTDGVRILFDDRLQATHCAELSIAIPKWNIKHLVETSGNTKFPWVEVAHSDCLDWQMQWRWMRPGMSEAKAKQDANWSLREMDGDPLLNHLPRRDSVSVSGGIGRHGSLTASSLMEVTALPSATEAVVVEETSLSPVSADPLNSSLSQSVQSFQTADSSGSWLQVMNAPEQGISSLDFRQASMKTDSEMNSVLPYEIELQRYRSRPVPALGSLLFSCPFAVLFENEVEEPQSAPSQRAKSRLFQKSLFNQQHDAHIVSIQVTAFQLSIRITPHFLSLSSSWLSDIAGYPTVLDLESCLDDIQISFMKHLIAFIDPIIVPNGITLYGQVETMKLELIQGMEVSLTTKLESEWHHLECQFGWISSANNATNTATSNNSNTPLEAYLSLQCDEWNTSFLVNNQLASLMEWRDGFFSLHKDDRLQVTATFPHPISVEFSCFGVENLFYVFEQWQEALIHFMNAFHSYQERIETERQRFMTALSVFAAALPQGDDPLFLTRPNNLWRLAARPHQSDSGWKRFMHLRFALNRMPEETKRVLGEALIVPLEKISTQSRVPFVQQLHSTAVQYLSGWRSWELGAMQECRLLNHLYKRKTPAQPLIVWWSIFMGQGHYKVSFAGVQCILREQEEVAMTATMESVNGVAQSEAHFIPSASQRASSLTHGSAHQAWMNSVGLVTIKKIDLECRTMIFMSLHRMQQFYDDKMVSKSSQKKANMFPLDWRFTLPVQCLSLALDARNLPAFACHLQCNQGLLVSLQRQGSMLSDGVKQQQTQRHARAPSMAQRTASHSISSFYGLHIFLACPELAFEWAYHQQPCLECRFDQGRMSLIVPSLCARHEKWQIKVFVTLQMLIHVLQEEWRLLKAIPGVLLLFDASTLTSIESNKLMEIFCCDYSVDRIYCMMDVLPSLPFEYELHDLHYYSSHGSIHQITLTHQSFCFPTTLLENVSSSVISLPRVKVIIQPQSIQILVAPIQGKLTPDMMKQLFLMQSALMKELIELLELMNFDRAAGTKMRQTNRSIQLQFSSISFVVASPETHLALQLGPTSGLYSSSQWQLSFQSLQWKLLSDTVPPFVTLSLDGTWTFQPSASSHSLILHRGTLQLLENSISPSLLFLNYFMEQWQEQRERHAVEMQRTLMHAKRAFQGVTSSSIANSTSTFQFQMDQIMINFAVDSSTQLQCSWKTALCQISMSQRFSCQIENLSIQFSHCLNQLLFHFIQMEWDRDDFQMTLHHWQWDWDELWHDKFVVMNRALQPYFDKNKTNSIDSVSGNPSFAKSLFQSWTVRAQKGLVVLHHAPVEKFQFPLFEVCFMPERGIKVTVKESWKWMIQSSTIAFMRPFREYMKQTDNNEEIALVPVTSVHFHQFILEFNCLPWSKVFASIQLDKMNVLLFSDATDSIAGQAWLQQCTVKVKHGFAPEDCLKWVMNPIHLSLQASPFTSLEKMVQYSIVMTVDQMNGEVNLRQWQDWIVFSKIWFNTMHMYMNLNQSNSNSIEISVTNDNALHFILSVHIHKCLTQMDLGPLLGKIQATLNDFDFSIINKSHCHLHLDEFHLLANGRMAGKGVAKQLSFLLQVDALQSLFHSWLQLEFLFIQWDYNFERVFSSELEKMTLTVQLVEENKEDGDGESNEMKRCLEWDWAISATLILSSRECFNAWHQSQSRFSTLMKEKEWMAKSTLATASFVAVEDGTSKSTSTKPQSSVSFPFSISQRKCTLRGAQSHVLAFGTSTLDPECLQCHVLGYVLSLSTESSTGHSREIFVQTQLLEFYKTTSHALNENDNVHANNALTNNSLESASFPKHLLLQENALIHKQILAFPPATLYMATDQETSDGNLSSPVTTLYEFVSEFDGWVDVSLHLGLYRFVRVLVDCYLEQISTDLGSPAMNSSQSPSSPRLASTASNPSRSNRLYRALTPMRLEPRLRITGEATPRFEKVLDWLGLQDRDRLPAALDGWVGDTFSFLLQWTEEQILSLLHEQQT